jgi:hypothetical protein
MEIVKTTVISTKTVTEMAEMTTETTTETETMTEAISETEIMATDQTMIEAALEEMTEMMPHQNQFRIRTERIEKTKHIFNMADVAVIVAEPNVWTEYESNIIAELSKKNTPVMVVVNNYKKINLNGLKYFLF